MLDGVCFPVFGEIRDNLRSQTPLIVQQMGKDRYMLPPKPDEVVMQTFCGT